MWLCTHVRKLELSRERERRHEGKGVIQRARRRQGTRVVERESIGAHDSIMAYEQNV